MRGTLVLMALLSAVIMAPSAVAVVWYGPACDTIQLLDARTADTTGDTPGLRGIDLAQAADCVEQGCISLDECADDCFEQTIGSAPGGGSVLGIKDQAGDEITNAYDSAWAIVREGQAILNDARENPPSLPA